MLSFNFCNITLSFYYCFTEELFIAPLYFRYDPAPNDIFHHFMVAYACVEFKMSWAEADSLIRDSFAMRFQLDWPGY